MDSRLQWNEYGMYQEHGIRESNLEMHSKVHA